MKLKIITFNWHEAYLTLLSKTNHDFYIVEPEIKPGITHKWKNEMRSLPENARLISLQMAREELDQGGFDLAIGHNVSDMVWLKEYKLPKILVFHNRLSTEIELGKNRVSRGEYLEKIRCLMDDATRVFISESKREDWGIDGSIILPGIDIDEYQGYTGGNPCVLRIGNHFKERDLMLGYSAGQNILGNHPCKILGINPTIPESRPTNGLDDLLDHFRSHRLYLNATVDGIEDGYNLAMLEAMATGMPVVSTWNRTSPIRDGDNGFISEDPQYLNRCVEKLLNDRDLARQMGERARETVRKEFSIQTFLKCWHTVIHESVLDFLKNTGVSMGEEKQPFNEKIRKNILMDYVSYPATTAYYLHRGLAKTHNVVTCGAMINDEVKKQWNLGAMKWKILPQDIFRANSMPLSEVMNQLPERWKPDLYLWVETGLGLVPPDLEKHSLPKACYLIDSHLHMEKHNEIAQRFDTVFLAQKVCVEKLKSEGFENVYWLPLACDPDIHGKKEVDKRYDVGFAGTVSEGSRRKSLLNNIEKNFHLCCERKFMDEMAELYSQSKMVYNNAIKDDLNMRVFEALCSGSLLVTDRASGSGLEEFFQDNKHLVFYEDDSLVDTIQYYLDHPEKRMEIEERGRALVLEKHTYAHRADYMIRMLDEIESKRDVKGGANLKKGEEKIPKDEGATITARIVEEAKLLEKQKQYDSAYLKYQDVLAAQPGHTDSLVDAGNCCMHLGNLEEAIKFYQKAMDNNPGSERGLVGLGLIELNAENFLEAAKYFKDALNINPANDRALCGLGLVHAQSGKREEAKKYFLESLERNIDNPPALTHLLQISYQDENYEDVEDCMKRFLEIHPANLNVLFGLAGVQSKLNRLDEALDTLELILIFDPDHKDALALKANFTVHHADIRS